MLRRRSPPQKLRKRPINAILHHRPQKRHLLINKARRVRQPDPAFRVIARAAIHQLRHTPMIQDLRDRYRGSPKTLEQTIG